LTDAHLIDQLLAAQTPSIRYLTLTRLQGLAESHPEVSAARRAMQSTGPIPVILAKQSEKGAWKGDKSYYTPKYTSSHWSMLLLAELQADPADARLRQGAAHMLEAVQEDLEQRQARRLHGWTCLWANILRYASHAGLAGDPRLEPVLAALVGDAIQHGWRCPYNHEHPCAWGAARALWGLSALPPGHKAQEAQAAIRSAVQFLLEEHSLIRVNYPLPAGVHIHEIWSRINFPLFYQADILFVLRAVADAGELQHPGTQPALEWLAERRKSDGRWSGASPFRQRTWRVMGERSEVDRWVSLQAADLLMQAGYGPAE
jgi:hypothetical protein